MDWTQRIAQFVASHGTVARVVIVDVAGPTPRAEGAAMLVTADTREGKIGRGAIEAEAIAAARRLIDRAKADAAALAVPPRWQRHTIEFATGPVLGEASGGRMTLLVELFTAFECAALIEQRGNRDGELLLVRPLTSGVAPVLTAGGAPIGAAWREAASALLADPTRSMSRLIGSDGQPWLVERLGCRAVRFHVYGTGLVARALVGVLADLPFEIVWLDSEPVNFPGDVPARIRAVPCPDLAEAARHTQPGGFHAVMAATHDLDLAVCRALLEEGTFAFLGLIGSHLKRQRLIDRLAGGGIPDAVLARLVCPIGLPEIRSKSPAVIAVSIAAQALIALQQTARPPTTQIQR